MRVNFTAALKLTLKDEGGNVDDPADRGGRTSRGVTQRTYDTWRKAEGLATRDVYLATDAEVSTIYLNSYWTPADGDLLAVGPDYAVFDYAVNSGVSRAKSAIPKDHMAADDMVRRICDSRTSFVNAIKDFAKFRKGVLARVARVEAAGVKMALATSTAKPEVVHEQLTKQAVAADKKAVSAQTKASLVAVPAVSSTAGVPASVGFHVDWWIWGLGGLLFCALVAAVVYYAYQHKKHEERGDAYATVTAETPAV